MPDADEPAQRARPTTLYRRYRPSRFGEVVGQDHVTAALRHAVSEGRVGHAYLFSGPRGTGKTTTARLLAKALNCLDPAPDGEPCGVCENCRSIAAGEFYDLVELDAASNRGVEAMRDLIQNVGLGIGATSKRKVYVVDEVHMLTDVASNALLKTLEEPPAHVLFVLATTEPGKVLPTIRSRTQHFEFGLLEFDALVGHLEHVLEQESVATDRDAVELVARRAAGSARDALSFLDQAIAIGDGALDPERVRAVLGDTPFDSRLAVLDAIAANDPAAALTAVASSLSAGTDPRRLADDLLRTARDAFVLSASAGQVVPPESTAEERTRLVALADVMGDAHLARAIEVIGQAIVDVRGPAAPDPRLVVEVAVVRLARADADADVDGLRERVAQLERDVATLRSSGPARAPARGASTGRDDTREPSKGSSGRRSGPKAALGASIAERASADGGAATAGAVATEEPPEVSALPAEEAAAEPGPSLDLTLDDVVEAWPTVLGALSTPVRSQVDVAQPIAVAGDVITFGAPSVQVKRIHAKFRENADAIKAALASTLGGAPKLKVVADESFSTAEVPNAPRRKSSSSAPADAPDPIETPPDDVVDLRDLVDDPGGNVPVDSASRLVQELGATVVEERPRA